MGVACMSAGGCIEACRYMLGGRVELVEVWAAAAMFCKRVADGWSQWVTGSVPQHEGVGLGAWCGGPTPALQADIRVGCPGRSGGCWATTLQW